LGGTKKSVAIKATGRRIYTGALNPKKNSNPLKAKKVLIYAHVH